MTLGRNKLCDRMSEGVERSDVKDREGVFALKHTTRREDDRNEVNTGVAQ